jgi:hypothetical protein
LITEQEAKQKWCPHAVASHTDPRRGFREGLSIRPDGMGHECIASACMAWRWQRDVAYRAYNAGPPPGKGWEKTGHTIHEGETVEWALSTGKGRCGLAGVE